jgi:hypothetical protein
MKRADASPLLSEFILKERRPGLTMQGGDAGGPFKIRTDIFTLFSFFCQYFRCQVV